MKPKLDKKLVKDFPKIFVNRYGDLHETAMCWGFDCGDGWYWLINALCSQLQWDTDKNGQPQVVASQVKEKYGTLRFYVESSNEHQNAMISLAESMSAKICEECGSTEFVKTRGKYWMTTLCNTCHADREKTKCQT